MSSTTYALNLAAVAGAARPCARIDAAGFVGMAQAQSVETGAWSKNHRNLPTTKRSTRRLRPPL